MNIPKESKHVTNKRTNKNIKNAAIKTEMHRTMKKKQHSRQCQRTKPANAMIASNASEQRTKKCNQCKTTKTPIKPTKKKPTKANQCVQNKAIRLDQLYVRGLEL